MYREHFGLEILPFKITPDPAFLSHNRRSRRALNLLRSDLAQQCPISVVIGDAGTGKTTLILHILKDIPKSVTVGLLSNFPGWADDILPWVLYTFEIPDASDDVTRQEAFEAFVRKEQYAGRKCLLIVDEAQNVSEQGLEQLRKLVNINTGKDLQFMVFLVGQPELCHRLVSPECAAIAQRIGVSVTLGPMSAAETEEYVRHRLVIAGGRPDIFDREAIAAIHRISGGYPRLVNVVCDTAMVMAYDAGEHRIGRDIIGMLGQKDSALSHLPDIADNARIGSTAEPSSRTVAASGICSAEIEDAHLRRDVFEFVPTRQRGITAEVVEERTPQSVKQPDERPEPAAPERAAVIPSTFLKPKRNPTRKGTGKSVPSLTRSKTPRKRATGRVSGESRKPVNRIGLRGLLGSTIAASIVAAGVFYLGPALLRETSRKEPLDLVSMQSASALSPAALSRVEMELPEAPKPLLDMSGKALLDRALASGVTDPAAAAIDYARAALRGEELAAYYLGQLYETGDGVPRNLAMARNWYSSVADSVRGARRRLEDLGDPDRTGELAAPKLLLGGMLDTDGAEFVWTSGDGADPAFFVVELSAGPESSVRRLTPQGISAVKVDSVDDMRYWRVFSVAPDMHRYAASDWTPIGALDVATSPRSGGVVPEAVVQLPDGTAPERLAAVTDFLDASRIPYRVESGAAGASNVTGLQIGYVFEGDEKAAHTIADAVGAQSAVMLSGASEPDQPRPFPGQLFIRPANR